MASALGNFYNNNNNGRETLKGVFWVWSSMSASIGAGDVVCNRLYTG